VLALYLSAWLRLVQLALAVQIRVLLAPQVGPPRRTVVLGGWYWYRGCL
jgi:hypothetical protein